MKYFFLFVCSLLFLLKCAEDKPTIDGTNQETFEESLDLMQRELPSDQAPKLREAVRLVYLYQTHQDTDELKASRTRQLLNRRNADDIFSMAESAARRNNIDWDRNSLGLLDFDKITVKKEENQEPTDPLQNAKFVTVSYQEIDQNKDGVYDGLMLFPQILDKEKQVIEFQNADLNADFSLYSDQSKVFQKNQAISHSNLGKKSLGRGVILPYAAFDAEAIKNDQMELTLRIIGPHSYLTVEEPQIQTHFLKFVKENRVDQEALEAEKNQAKKVVTDFISFVGSGQLQEAHDLSVNPEWRDFTTFSSEDLGFGSVVHSEIKNSKVEAYDPQKEKAKILVQYEFTLKDDIILELEKEFILQKIAGEWKIVSSKKV